MECVDCCAYCKFIILAESTSPYRAARLYYCTIIYPLFIKLCAGGALNYCTLCHACVGIFVHAIKVVLGKYCSCH